MGQEEGGVAVFLFLLFQMSYHKKKWFGGPKIIHWVARKKKGAISGTRGRKLEVSFKKIKWEGKEKEGGNQWDKRRVGLLLPLMRDGVPLPDANPFFSLLSFSFIFHFPFPLFFSCIFSGDKKEKKIKDKILVPLMRDGLLLPDAKPLFFFFFFECAISKNKFLGNLKISAFQRQPIFFGLFTFTFFSFFLILDICHPNQCSGEDSRCITIEFFLTLSTKMLICSLIAPFCCCCI